MEPSETPPQLAPPKGPAYRRGGPVLAVHETVLAVEIVILRKLWK